MDERAQLAGMHFGIEIETVNLNRKDTVEAIQSIIGGTVEYEGVSKSPEINFCTNIASAMVFAK